MTRSKRFVRVRSNIRLPKPALPTLAEAQAILIASHRSGNVEQQKILSQLYMRLKKRPRPCMDCGTLAKGIRCALHSKAHRFYARRLAPIACVVLAGCATAPKPVETIPPTPPKPLFSHILIIPEPPRPPVYKRLPPFQFPKSPASHWVLQESSDLIHWHNLAHLPAQAQQSQLTAPAVGSKFFRMIGSSTLPDGMYTNRPDLWLKLGGDQ